MSSVVAYVNRRYKLTGTKDRERKPRIKPGLNMTQSYRGPEPNHNGKNAQRPLT